jgi:hypothetical protein
VGNEIGSGAENQPSPMPRSRGGRSTSRSPAAPAASTVTATTAGSAVADAPMKTARSPSACTEPNDV